MSAHPDRAYTVAEIDRMREAVRETMAYEDGFRGVTHGPGGERWTWGSLPDDDDTEAHLRTYMKNGTDPAELEARARKALRDRIADDERSRLLQLEWSVLVEAAPPAPRVEKRRPWWKLWA